VIEDIKVREWFYTNKNHNRNEIAKILGVEYAHLKLENEDDLYATYDKKIRCLLGFFGRGSNHSYPNSILPYCLGYLLRAIYFCAGYGSSDFIRIHAKTCFYMESASLRTKMVQENFS